MKKIKIIICLLCGLLISHTAVFAAWWQIQSIPLPSGSKEQKQEKRLIVGNEQEFTYYTTNLSPLEVRDFYITRAPASGWERIDILSQLERVSPGKITDDMKRALDFNLIFEKDNKQLVVTIMPEGSIPGAETRFTTILGEKPSNLKELPAESQVPVLLDKPKKQVFPVYPGASLTNLAEERDFLQARYLSQDQMETIAQFYKNQMPSYGWSLYQEKLPEKIIGQDASAVDAWISELKFTRKNDKERCDVIISQAVSKIEEQDNLSITNIMVNYVREK